MHWGKSLYWLQPLLTAMGRIDSCPEDELYAGSPWNKPLGVPRFTHTYSFCCYIWLAQMAQSKMLKGTQNRHFSSMKNYRNGVLPIRMHAPATALSRKKKRLLTEVIVKLRTIWVLPRVGQWLDTAVVSLNDRIRMTTASCCIGSGRHKM